MKWNIILNIYLYLYISWSVLLLEYGVGALADSWCFKAHGSPVLGDPRGEADAGIGRHPGRSSVEEHCSGKLCYYICKEHLCLIANELVMD